MRERVMAEDFSSFRSEGGLHLGKGFVGEDSWSRIFAVREG